MNEVISEILKSQIHIVAGLLLLWGMLGAIGGILGAVVAYIGATRFGAFRLAWRHAVWLRVPTAIWLVLTFTCCSAMLGGCEGSLRGVRRVVQHSQFRTEVLARAGNAAADGLLEIDTLLADPNGTAPLEAFRRGEIDLDVQAFLKRLDSVEEQTAHEIVDRVRVKLRGQASSESGLVWSLTEQMLEFVAKRLLRRKALEEFERFGVADAVIEFFDTLPNAARRQGDRLSISRQELAEHVVEHGLIPAILGPAKGFVRSQQFFWLLLMLLAFVIPVLGFWIGRRLESRRAVAAPPAETVA